MTCDDPALSSIEVSLSGATDSLTLTRFTGRSNDGLFREGFRLLPGTYRVEALAGERRADGELVVGPEEGVAPRLELVLP